MKVRPESSDVSHPLLTRFDYGCDVNILETHLLFVGIPVVVIGSIGALAMRSSAIPGKHPSHYSLGNPWTHEPILWTAVDEVTTKGHHGAHDEAHGNLIGGRASGKW